MKLNKNQLNWRFFWLNYLNLRVVKPLTKTMNHIAIMPAGCGFGIRRIELKNRLMAFMK